LIRYTRDEVYIVASGTGVFVTPDRRQPFKPADLVSAGAEHRFEDFSGDFAVAGAALWTGRRRKACLRAASASWSKAYRRRIGSFACLIVFGYCILEASWFPIVPLSKRSTP
jgi:hypothetical protein